MRSVLLLDPTHEHQWDGFVRAHPFGLIGHLSGWKEVLERTFSHIRGYFLVLIDPNDGGIRAGLPIYLVSSPLTGRRLVSIPFATLSDPLVTSTGEVEQLLEAACSLAADLKATRIEIRTLASAHLMENSCYRRVDLFRHHFLTVDEPVEILLKRFHRTSIRPAVKRCEHNGLELKTDCSDEALRSFFNQYVRSRKRLGLPPQPFRFFENICRIFAPSDQVKLLHAFYGGKPIAGLVLFQFKNRVSAEFIAVDHPYKHLNPAHFLFWQGIMGAHHDGFEIFDFGRTSLSNIGLMSFKSRWGTTATDLPQYWFPANNNVSPEYMDNSLKYQVIKGVVRKTPETLLPLLGEFCYRHMG